MDWNLDLQVLGERIQANIGEQLRIMDLSNDMDEVASLIGYWGEVWGRAEEEKVRVDGEYRHWAARIALKLMDDPKRGSEWKVKAAVEGDPKFREWKAAIGRTEYNVTTLKAVFEAFKAKGNQLQSRGARERAELEKTGMRTMETPKAQVSRTRVEVDGDAPPADPDKPKASPEDKKAKIREMNMKKKPGESAK